MIIALVVDARGENRPLEMDQTSSLSVQHFGIEVAELDAGVVGGELPIDADLAAIAALFPDPR